MMLTSTTRIEVSAAIEWPVWYIFFSLASSGTIEGHNKDWLVPVERPSGVSLLGDFIQVLHSKRHNTCLTYLPCTKGGGACGKRRGNLTRMWPNTSKPKAPFLATGPMLLKCQPENSVFMCFLFFGPPAPEQNSTLRTQVTESHMITIFYWNYPDPSQTVSGT